MGQALFCAKPLKGLFRKGTVEYTSRVTGKKYTVEPDWSGFLLSSDDLLIYTGSHDKAEAFDLIELADQSQGLRELIASKSG